MWNTVRNAVTFTAGVAVLLWQTILEDQAQSILVGAALVLMGVLPTDTWLRRK